MPGDAQSSQTFLDNFPEAPPGDDCSLLCNQDRSNVKVWTKYIVSNDLLIPVTKLHWDHSGTQGQIRPLDLHVGADYERSLMLQPPVKPVEVYCKDMGGMHFFSTRDPAYENFIPFSQMERTHCWGASILLLL